MMRQLPSQCSQLRSLSFSHKERNELQVQMGASSSHPGVLSTCAGSLTRLEVHQCALLDASAAATAAGLASLTGLQC